MPGSYVVGDTEYRFPDDYTDEQVQGILTQQGVIKAEPPAHSTAQGPQMILPEQEVRTPRPPVMATVMPRIAGTGTYRARNGGPQLTVPEAKPPGEKMPGGGPTLNAPAGPETMPVGQLASDLVNKPLIDPETFQGGKTADNMGGYAVDAAQSGLSAAAGMTSPANLAIMVATMGLGAVPGVLARLGSAGVAAYFATEGGKAALEQYPELKHHAEQGDWHAVAANAGAIAANVAMAAGAGLHGGRELGKVPGEALRTGAQLADVAARNNVGGAGAPPQQGFSMGGDSDTGATATPFAKVKKVSPATPGAPTAATPTTPESPATIEVQMGQLGRFGEPVHSAQRRVVMFPQGEGMPDYTALDGLQLTHDKFGNVYAYRADLIEPGEIHRAANNNTLPEVLGGPEGMGAPDKSAMEDPTHAVVARGPDGTEAQATATDEANLPQTVQATSQVVPEGGTLGVEPVENVVAERAGEAAPPPGFDFDERPAEAAGGEAPQGEAPQAGPEATAAEPARQPNPSVTLGMGLGGLDPIIRQSIEEIRALAEKRSQAKAALDRAAASPAEKNFGQKIIEYFTGERDLFGTRVNQVIEEIRRQVPDGIDQQALSLLRDFKNRPGELESFLDGTHPDFQDPDAKARIAKLEPVIERALNPTPEMLQADQGLTALAQYSLIEGQRLGFLDSTIDPDEYVKHLLNPIGTGDLPKAFGGAKDWGRRMGKIGRNLDSAQKRNYPTLLHAVGDGLVPKTLNALDAFTIYGDKFATTRATRLLINMLKQQQAGIWGGKAGSGHVPAEWVKLAPHAHEFENHLVIADRNGEPAHLQQSLFVPSYIEAALRPITDPDYMNRIAGFSKWRQLGAYTKAIQLGMSLFHATTMNYMAGANMGAKGWYRALTGKVDGNFLAEERDMVLHSGTSPIQGKTFEAYKGLEPGLIPTYGDMAARLPVVKQVNALAQGITELTFGKLQRRFKVWNYSLAKAGWLADHPNASAAELNAAKHSIAKEINAVYGGLHWENLGINQATVGTLRAIILAPDWTLSNLFNYKYATERGTPAGSMARMFWARTVAGGLVATQMMSLAMSQKLSKHPTEVYLGTDKDGKEIYQNMFFKGAPGDLVTLINNTRDYGAAGPIRTLGNKLGPIPRTMMQLVNNENYQKQPIARRGAGMLENSARVAGHIAKGMGPVPLSVSNTWNALTGPDSDATTYKEVGTTMFAGTPPRHEWNRGTVSAAEQIALDHNLGTQQGRPTTPHSKAKTSVYMAAKSGDIQRARQLGSKAVAAGVISAQDVNSQIRRARANNPLGDTLKAIRTDDGVGLSVVLRAFEAATPEERAKVAGIVRSKVATARTRPWEWGEEGSSEGKKARALALKYFNTRPAARQSPGADLATPPAIQ